MTYRLYGDLGSGAFSVEAALAEAGAPYEFELISLEKGEPKEPRPKPQSQRQNSGAAPSGSRDRHWILAEPFLLASDWTSTPPLWSVGARWREQDLPHLNRLARLISERPAIAPVWKQHFTMN